MKAKRRIDQLLVDRALAPSREKAQALILAGQVMVDGRSADKPGQTADPESRVEVLQPMPYVSRGGLKLAAALDHFPIAVDGRVCLDVGSSTGGFTDCLLQRGAARVYAVDVGTGQLDWKLRNDPRVIVRERRERALSGGRRIPGADGSGGVRCQLHLGYDADSGCRGSDSEAGRRDGDLGEAAVRSWSGGRWAKAGSCANRSCMSGLRRVADAVRSAGLRI